MKLIFALFAFGLAASAASAAGIEGHWTAQLAQGKKATTEAPAPFTLDLKTAGGSVSGSVALPGKKKPQIQRIENGKLDGDRLTFTTSQKGKNSTSFSWEVTLQGDQLAGTRTRDGAKHGQTFTAQRIP